MILSFLNQKGGVGKTTLAINAAAYYHNESFSVLLVDADPQGTATHWGELREDAGLSVIQLVRDNMAKELVVLAEKYDRVVIDGPPRAESLSRAVIIASDLVIIPIEPSGASDWASEVTRTQIQEALDYKPDLRATFVIARALPGTILGSDIREHVANVGLPIMSTTIYSRVAFAEALTLGQTIYEWAPGSKAERETTNLMNEIERELNG